MEVDHQDRQYHIYLSYCHSRYLSLLTNSYDGLSTVVSEVRDLKSKRESAVVRIDLAEHEEELLQRHKNSPTDLELSKDSSGKPNLIS